ncbi:MAG: hypothetical protein K0R71_1749 [Bacillales bacterium]|jgi:hypothetical protein|nr:hypothetical protein [Bacillales bacterium]
MSKIPSMNKVEHSIVQKEILFHSDKMVEEGSLFTGLLWGTLLSIPLWISIIGWGKLVMNFIS